MISFEQVRKIYPNGTEALLDATITINQGEFVSIVGPSGAGKTTFTKLILAEEYPTDGIVMVDNVDVHKLKNTDITEYRRRIGFVFQDFRLLNNKTVYENIAFAMEAVGKTDDEIAEDVPHVLALVGLAAKTHDFPKELSGGEKQRLAIARAIINQPEIIIADEPTGNLDPMNTFEIINILKKINELGTTVLLTTHNKIVVDAVGKRVITLEKGRIIRDDEKGSYVLS